MTLRMGDGPVANLPHGLDAYAGYVNVSGIGETYREIVAAFPGAHHLPITTDGSPADCADVERGAMGDWSGYPVGYTSTSNAGAVILRYGRPKKLWTAHYTNTPHICTSQQCWPSSPVAWIADGTQWTDHNGLWDESLLADDFFSYQTPPPPPAPTTRKDVPDMVLANDGKTQYIVTTDSAGHLVKNPIVSLADPDHNELAQIAAVIPNLGAVPTFLAAVPNGTPA